MAAASSAPSVPSAPTLGTVFVGKNDASIYVNASTSTGGSPISTYTVVCSNGATASSNTGNNYVYFSAPASGFVIGQSYRFYAYATNSFGNSPNSAWSDYYVNYDSPGVPGFVTASRLSSTSIYFTWQEVYAGGGTVIYECYLQPSNTLIASTTSTNITKTGLAPGSYSLWVQPRNQAYWSLYGGKMSNTVTLT